MKQLNVLGTTFVAVAAIGLSGCDDAGSQDSGQSDNDVQLSGTVVDGYVAGARVWADINDNGRIDTFEPVARTDRYGFFTQRPKLVTGDYQDSADTDEVVAEARDYCDTQGEHFSERYCLRVSEASEGAVIRMLGGYDVLTGERFEGGMSRRVGVAGDVTDSSLAVSPLTSLRSGAGTSAEDADTDGDNFWGGYDDAKGVYVWQDDVDGDELEWALKLHKVVDVVVAGLEKHFEDAETISLADGEDWTGTDISFEIYSRLYEELGSPVDLSQADFTDLQTDLETAIEAFDGVGSVKADLADIGKELYDAIEGLDMTASAGANSAAASSDYRNDARAIEVAVNVAREDSREEGGSATTQATSDRDYAEILGATVNTFSGGAGDEESEKVDVAQMARDVREAREQADEDGTNFDAGEAVGNAFKRNRVDVELPEITGTVLELRAQGENDDGEEAEGSLIFYFQPEEGETIPADNTGWIAAADADYRYQDRGRLSACLAATGDIDFGGIEDEEENTDAIDQDGDTAALHISGEWERLSDRSLLMSIDIPGVEPLNIRVRGGSNDWTVRQFYNQDVWTDGNLALGDATDHKGISRDEYWNELSHAYWATNDSQWNDENVTEEMVNTFFTQDADDNTRYVASAPADNRYNAFQYGEEGSVERVSTLDGLTNDKRADYFANGAPEDHALTPRGWVFAVDYDGDQDRWDVEHSRDEALANGEAGDVRLRLFTPYEEGNVPADSAACGDLM